METKKVRSKIATDFIRLYKLSNYLFETTRQMFYQIAYDAVRVLYYKEKRKLKEQSRGHRRNKRPFRLKKIDFTRVFILLDYHYCNCSTFIVENQLAACFGDFSEQEALDYYEKDVEGELEDINGDKIVFPLYGIKFLYKDPKTGDHEIDPKNYDKTRGKRLPWLKHTIENTKEIYEERGDYWSTFYYVGTFKIPLWDKSEKINYFVIIIRKEKKQPRKFKTAYPIFKSSELLKRIERSHPYLPDQKAVELIEENK